MKRITATIAIRDIKANLHHQEEKVVQDVINNTLAHIMYAIGTVGIYYEIRCFL